MSLFSALFGPPRPPAPPDPYWQRNADLKYPRLIHLASHSRFLAGKGGVFVVWVVGMQGAWITCGSSGNLEETVQQLANAPSIQEWEQHGSVVFTWASVLPDKRDGVVAYLRTTLSFKGLDDALDRRLGLDPERLKAARPVPVLPPG